MSGESRTFAPEMRARPLAGSRGVCHISTNMKVKEILGALEEFAPLALQDGYDNAGLQIGLAEDAEATGALLCLDVTEAVVDEAVGRGCNLIVSHHPLLFRGLKSVTADDYVGRTVMRAIQKGVAVYAAHTNLDSAHGGVNWKMAEKLGLQGLEWLSPKGEYSRGGEKVTAGEGLVGRLPKPLPKAEFCQLVKDAFRLQSLRVNDCDKAEVGTVALCGGSGAFLIPQAVAKGADAFMTGEIGYHRFFGYEHDLLLLETGHYESEQYTLEVLRQVVRSADASLPIYDTELKTNPINYL